MRRFDDPDPLFLGSLGFWTALAVAFAVRAALAPIVTFELRNFESTRCGMLLLPKPEPPAAYETPQLAKVVDAVPHEVDPPIPPDVDAQLQQAIDDCEPRIRHERIELSVVLGVDGTVETVFTEPRDSIGPCVQAALAESQFELTDAVLKTVVDWQRR